MRDSLAPEKIGSLICSIKKKKKNQTHEITHFRKRYFPLQNHFSLPKQRVSGSVGAREEKKSG